MAGSTIKTVYDIFQSMDYGPTSSSTATAQAWLEHQSGALGLFIDGRFVLPAGRQTCSVTDSSGGSVCTTVCATDEDVSLSVSSGASGFKAWSALPCHVRAKTLLRLVSGLQRYGQCLSELCDLAQSPSSFSALVRLLQYYSGWAQLRDTLLPDWTPRGLVAVVVSDDCSLYSLMLKALPALAMGNTVVVIPGVETAIPALLLAQLFVEAGLPAGVLNVVTGNVLSLASTVAQNPLTSYVTYSGNKNDGEKLCRATAGMGVPVSLSISLGATCPFIIFESADIDSAVDGVIETAFKKKRECQWLLCVQESVLDIVVARLKSRMAGMKSVPLQKEGDRRLVDAAVEEAQQQGATLIQPCAPSPSGASYPPTVLCGMAPSCPCVVTPPPGPLLPLLSFRSQTEGVTLGNHSPHGYAASLWTEDLTLALEAAKGLSVGSVWVNSHSVLDPSLPLSGHKESSNCTDGGKEGLFQFLRPSSSSPSLPRSSPTSLDYSRFGTATSAAIIPQGPDSSSCPRSYLQYVGGKQCKSESGSSVSVLAPDGAVLAYCPDAGRKDVRNAVEAAIKVQPGWMKRSPTDRAQSLFTLAKALEMKRRDLAASLHSQTGLSLEEVDKEVELSIAQLYDWAARCDKETGGILPVPQSGSALSIPEALGVVGVVLPDSSPLLSMVSLLVAAVAMGNAVVMVPSPKNPLPALEFIQVLQSSDIPAGVVNILTGGRDQLTQALANHSVIKAIWYWGSVEGCQYLQHTCASPLKNLWLHCLEEKDGGRVWSQPPPSLLEERWRRAVQWKSVWIPTA
ncbi:aldehyde dehydrogenase family 16 member A1 isoform X2 [Esox lucius]|uniref:aldehyde dehydrogenase family 16 member A1 isoform X2 n=1 Tax=Esox lucius TaxID=8010 RepID=UPI001476BBD7|nr:aldehyde dehydrogenase family 16 member A1 isoform X2 [Esox lucius]